MLAPLKAGDHVVASKAMFGSCRYVVEDLLPRYGIASTLVDGLDLDQWRNAMRPNTRSCFLESPTNPTLDVLDIGAIADIAHHAGARLIVDNVFATPIWQSPLALGADVVVYSATKHIDGQGRCLGGIILASQAFITDQIHTFMRQTGPSMSPFNAWVLLKGLETLAIRVRAQTETAAAIAERAGAASEGFAVGLSGPRRPPAGSHGQEADARRDRRWSDSRSRAARRQRSAASTRSSWRGFPTISATPKASSPIRRRRRISGWRRRAAPNSGSARALSASPSASSTATI